MHDAVAAVLRNTYKLNAVHVSNRQGVQSMGRARYTLLQVTLVDPDFWEVEFVVHEAGRISHRVDGQG